MSQAITYLRVSSESQGKSGLGIEAQCAAVEQFLAAQGLEKLVAFTRAAPAAKKAQGAKLGNRTNLAEAGSRGHATMARQADQFAANVRPIIEDARTAGATALQDLADALNARGVRTARGGRWHPMTVRAILERPKASA